MAAGFGFHDVADWLTVRDNDSPNRLWAATRCRRARIARFEFRQDEASSFLGIKPHNWPLGGAGGCPLGSGTLRRTNHLILETRRAEDVSVR